jgi:hypothetical protein
VDDEMVAAISAKARQLKDDPVEFAALDSIFAELRNKLPSELRASESNDIESAPPVSPNHIRAALDSAVDLISSLLSETESP